MLNEKTQRIYRDMKRLRSMLFHDINRLPKWLKHIIGSKLIDNIFNAIRYLSFALDKNISTNEQIKNLNYYITELYLILDIVAFLTEEAVLPLKRCSEITLLTDSIFEQTSKLKKYLDKNIPPEFVKFTDNKESNL